MLVCIKVKDRYYLTDHTYATRLGERLEAGEEPDTPCNRVRSYESHVAEIDDLMMKTGFSKGSDAFDNAKKMNYVINDLEYKLTRAKQLAAICNGEVEGYPYKETTAAKAI